MTKVMIYATTRSGSNYLHSCFNNYTDLQWVDVPFDFRQYHTLGLDDYQQILNDSVQDLKYNTNIIWKVHPTDLAEKRMYCNYQDVIKQLVNLPDYTIALTRRNLVDSAISQMIGRTTKIWNYPYNYKDITISPTVMEEVCDNILYYHLYEFVNNLYKVKVNEIVYFENFTFDQIVDLNNLSLDSIIKPQDQTIDIQPTPNKELIIRNYGEVLDYVNNYFLYVSNDYFLVKDGILQGFNDENLFP